MQIEYENHQVKKMFDDFENIGTTKHLLEKKVGKELTKAIRKRIIQIIAAETFDIYLKNSPRKPHLLVGGGIRYSVHLTSNWRLIIKPKITENTIAQLRECQTILIEGVVDYHGKKEHWLIP